MFIKKIVIFITILLFASLSLSAGTFTKSASSEPVLVQKGDEKHWCCVCGMNLKMFYKTSHASKSDDDTHRQYCSMRCLAVDMDTHPIDVNEIQVVDASTQKLIKAKTAFYVLGSTVEGTMSKVSKFAFASQSDAKNFVKEYKGQIVDFESALKNAKESLVSDTEMITAKKTKKIYPMGQTIFEKMCLLDIDINKYGAINELKSALQNKKLCKPLKEQQLQAVALYLWELKRFGDLEKTNGKIQVTEEEKCPVCGMFIYKYPKWAAQIFYEINKKEHRYSFDGVKDLMKFYFNPAEWGNYEVKTKGDITKILVTDYYSQKAIEAKKAYFVLGSDVYGPMGNELIPFENENDAQTFYKDHRGSKLIKFEEITPQEVSKLDE
ncbi:nitrous oxide reductase accessory protein NosL [bacterium]|nr:nitrous oxide reductase accessory protein NosL [bacterium]MBU1994571.1 nitrous oxide reductase accessory protein NosL [bacterium]